MHLCISLTVPNPVMIRVDPSQDLCPNRNPNTITLTWNQPTRFRECISRYTLETTTARGSRTTSVTSNTTSVSVGCCLRYNFTVTPSYTTRSPTGQGTTRDIPCSFVSGQSSKSIIILCTKRGVVVWFLTFSMKCTY